MGGPHFTLNSTKNEQVTVGGLTDLLVPHGRPEQNKPTTKHANTRPTNRVVGGVVGAEGRGAILCSLHLPSRASRDEGGDGITGVPGQEWSVVPAPP